MPKSASSDGLLQLGELVDGKYRIEARIGHGGMSAIYLANHEILGRRVALKVLLPQVAANPESVQRFLLEGRAAAQLRNEHVAAVLDVGTLPDGGAYIVLEYLQGCDLSQLCKEQGALPAEEVCDYVLQALEAVAHAHARGIVHRDLKPANLFLTTSSDGLPMVKVLDFGISKAVGAASASSSNLTHTNTMLGSPNFMSPEQVRSPKTVDARSDVWAMGVILYQLLSGALPFSGENYGEVLGAVLEATPTPLRELCPDLPEGLESVVARCLKRPKEERFADVAELAAALKPYAAPESQGHADRVARILVAGADEFPSANRRLSSPGTPPPASRSGSLSPGTPHPRPPGPGSVSRSQRKATGSELPTYTPIPDEAKTPPEGIPAAQAEAAEESPARPPTGSGRPPSQNRRRPATLDSKQSDPPALEQKDLTQPAAMLPTGPAAPEAEVDAAAPEEAGDSALPEAEPPSEQAEAPAPRNSVALALAVGACLVLVAVALGAVLYVRASGSAEPVVVVMTEPEPPAKVEPPIAPPPAVEKPAEPAKPAPKPDSKPAPEPDPTPEPAAPEAKPVQPAPPTPPAAAATPKPAAPRGPGTLKVITRLSGKAFWATVAIDGKPAATPTPLTVSLAPGRHRVKVEREGFASIEREVAIAPGETEVLKLDLVK